MNVEDQETQSQHSRWAVIDVRGLVRSTLSETSLSADCRLQEAYCANVRTLGSFDIPMRMRHTRPTRNIEPPRTPSIMGGLQKLLKADLAKMVPNLARVPDIVGKEVVDAWK